MLEVVEVRTKPTVMQSNVNKLVLTPIPLFFMLHSQLFTIHAEQYTSYTEKFLLYNFLWVICWSARVYYLATSIYLFILLF